MKIFSLSKTANLIMQNEKEYSVFKRIYLKGLGNLKIKFDIWTNSSILNSMVLSFSILHRKYPFWVNLVEK